LKNHNLLAELNDMKPLLVEWQNVEKH